MDGRGNPTTAGNRKTSLTDGWQAASTAPDRCVHPDALHELDASAWLPAGVPGTAAAALCEAGLWRPGDRHDLDARDWWFRTRFDTRPATPDEQVLLRIEGIATVGEVFLNGELLLSSDSMFVAHALDVGELLQTHNELAIRCRALSPLLAERRRPRQRWRTRLVDEPNLRFYRTMLLGRAPGFAPDPAAVGPWREVAIERRRAPLVDDLRVRAGIQGEDGLLSVSARLRPLGGPAPSRVLIGLRALQPSQAAGAADAGWIESPLELAAIDGRAQPAEELAQGEQLEARGQLRIAQPARWWPHTHGDPALYEASLLIELPDGQTLAIDAGRVGFRELDFGGPAHEIERDGLDLHVNGLPVFARGAVWTPIDPVGLAPAPQRLREALQAVRDAGMNIVRLPGTGAYEQEHFHELCDELGLLVWQDMMFANLDYPFSDPAFAETVRQEAMRVLGRLAAHPSLAVVCGNSEIEQQVAMYGLDPELGRGETFGELLPTLLAESGADAAYLPSAPCGGDLPFRTDVGVANYYGIGGYRRPLQDARRAEVRFAAECLAFANVPDPPAVEQLLPDAPGQIAVHHPRWKAGVPRDSGAGWDFDDVRDHYLELLYGIDPGELRRHDHERYLALSRQLTGEVMAEVFGEWRRARSPCRGAIVQWLTDLQPGAGWGIIDHRGEPKAAYHHLRRVLAPVAVWMVDEGLGGIDVHVANDRPEPLAANLRVALYSGERQVDEASAELALAGHDTWEGGVEMLTGHFADVAWSYRFGPPQQDTVVASLERDDVLLSQSVRFPAGPPIHAQAPSVVGLDGALQPGADGSLQLRMWSRLTAWGVRVHVDGWRPEDDAFCLEPGRERSLRLHPLTPAEPVPTGAILTALNIAGAIPVACRADREMVPDAQH